MAEYINFYENLTEAHQRLLQTLIMYDGEPYRVVAITDHREKDKIFSIYLMPLPYRPSGWPSNVEGFRHGSKEQGEYLDNWMKENKDNRMLRKNMNSPKFNKFRPFPLGMINERGVANFLQRQPQRTRESGLSRNSILQTNISLDGTGYEGPRQSAIETEEMRDCILGIYPSYAECITQLKKPDVGNFSVAFNRNFAIIRGPLNLFFLNYKADTIGLIRNDDQLLLGKEYKHFREVVEELGTFSRVEVQS